MYDMSYRKLAWAGAPDISESRWYNAWRIPVNTVMELATCNKHYLADVFENVLLFKFDILFSSVI